MTILKKSKRVISLVLKIISTVHSLFMTGHQINDIKSMCLVLYANYLHDQKIIDRAIEYYYQAIKLNNENFYAYGGLASALIQKRQYEQALEYCRKAKSLHENILISILIFIILDLLGKPDEANETLKVIMKYFKNDLAQTYDRLSYTYYKSGLHEKAEFYCHKAIDSKPMEAKSHFNLASIYIAQHKMLEARMELKKVLNLNPTKQLKRYSINKIEKISSLQNRRKFPPPRF